MYLVRNIRYYSRNLCRLLCKESSSVADGLTVIVLRSDVAAQLSNLSLNTQQLLVCLSISEFIIIPLLSISRYIIFCIGSSLIIESYSEVFDLISILMVGIESYANLFECIVVLLLNALYLILEGCNLKIDSLRANRSHLCLD